MDFGIVCGPIKIPLVFYPRGESPSPAALLGETAAVGEKPDGRRGGGTARAGLCRGHPGARPSLPPLPGRYKRVFSSLDEAPRKGYPLGQILLPSLNNRRGSIFRADVPSPETLPLFPRPYNGDTHTRTPPHPLPPLLSRGEMMLRRRLQRRSEPRWPGERADTSNRIGIPQGFRLKLLHQ